MADKKIKNKSRVGRPSSYTPEMSERAQRVCMLGATNEDLAKSLGIAKATVDKWLRDIPEFACAVKKGRSGADSDVAVSLYKRACGYSHPETKAQWVESEELIDGVPVKVGRWVYADMIKHHPPDTGAAFIWLKNRRPDLWRQQPEQADGSDVPKPVKITIQVEDAGKK